MLANRGIAVSFVIYDLPFGCNPIRSFYIYNGAASLGVAAVLGAVTALSS